MNAVLIGGPPDGRIVELVDGKSHYNVVTPAMPEGYSPGMSKRGERRPMLTKVYHYVKTHEVAGVAILELKE